MTRFYQEKTCRIYTRQNGENQRKENLDAYF